MSQRKGKEIAKPKSVPKKYEIHKPIAFRRNAICVISGMESGKDEAFHHEAIELGRTISARGLGLTYGGGILGLGATAAVTAMSRGSRVTGITVESGAGIRSLTSVGEELRIKNPHERPLYMLGSADAFVVVPCGLDGMNVLSSLLFWANIHLHQKPLGFLNVNGFFDEYLVYLNRLGEQGFITSSVTRLIVSAPTAGRLVEMLVSLMETTSQIVGVPPVQQLENERRGDGPDMDDPNVDGPDTSLKL